MSAFDFSDERLGKFRAKIRRESQIVINDIIAKYSPIQKGEDVQSISYAEEIVILRVIEVELYVVDLWGSPGRKLSFSYTGVLLKKDGTPMKKRNPIWFGSFVKNGKPYHMPSYDRIKIVAAEMY